MGRPKKEINYESVEKLAKIMCTQKEIAEYIGVDVRTLLRDEEFCHVYKKGIEQAKQSLRRAQFKKALEGNTSMLIWLGKQYLDQKDDSAEKTKKLKVEATKLKEETKKIKAETKSMSIEEDDGVVIVNDLQENN